MRPSILGFFYRGYDYIVYVDCKLRAVFCWVWGEEGAGCFVWVEMKLVLLCP